MDVLPNIAQNKPPNKPLTFTELSQKTKQTLQTFSCVEFNYLSHHRLFGVMLESALPVNFHIKSGPGKKGDYVVSSPGGLLLWSICLEKRRELEVTGLGGHV